MFSEDDFHYALETTEVLYEPDRRIDTFGSTIFEFQLLSELMDEANRVRIRSGRVTAERPLIIKPEPKEDWEFEGFGEKAEAFAHWFKDRLRDKPAIRYGFTFRKSDITESVVHESLEQVRDRVVEDARRRGNPLSAVIQGVDDTWEVSLIKFALEMFYKSYNINKFDFKRRGLM